MAPPRKVKKDSTFLKQLALKCNARDLIALAKNILFDPSYTWVVAIVLLLAEVFINVVVIEKVRCKLHAWPKFRPKISWCYL